jgi:hypothetical protein
MKADCRACIVIFALAFPGLLLTGCNWDDQGSGDAAAQSAPPQSSPPQTGATHRPPPPSAPAAGSPTISGTPPASIAAGVSYTFHPVASGPSGMALTFAIQNKPAWAVFDAASGLLSGIPSAANVGTYTQIAISVSDGEKSAMLGPFSIEVAQPQSVAQPPPVVTVSWTSPTLNTNGTAVTDLAGYHIYYGPTATQLNQVVDVAGADVTTFVLSKMSPGTWYFAVAAYNSEKVESALSPVLPISI